MPAFVAANGPRRPWFSGLRADRIVFPFPVDFSDRMDRRKIQNVEPHGSNSRRQTDAIQEGAMFAGLQGTRSGKQFIPRTEQRFFMLDYNLKFRSQGRILLKRMFMHNTG